MSDFQDATFLPPTLPNRAVIDYSATLDGATVGTLEAQALTLKGLKPTIVILPENFSADNLPQFARQLAANWEVYGHRLLLVVDLKAHKVQMVAGKDLADAGLTSNVISQQIIPQNFVPYMRNGDLAGAISHTLVATSSVVKSGAKAAPAAPPAAQSQSARTGADSETADSFLIPQPEPAAQSASIASPSAVPETVPQQESFFGSISGILISLGVIAAIGAALYFASEVKQKKENDKLSDIFNKACSPLYEKADQIGAGSEYMPRQEHPDLAKRIATFFNRLTTFEEAVGEVRGLERTNHVWKVRDGYLKLIQMIGLLAPEAESLKSDLDAATGGVETFKSADSGTNLNDQVERQGPKSASPFISAPGKPMPSKNFSRPSWSYEPVYGTAIGAGAGLAGMLLLMNQMQNIKQGSAFASDSESDFSTDINNTGSLWGSYDNSASNSGSVDGGGSWSDSSSSDSDSSGAGSEGGGSW